MIEAPKKIIKREIVLADGRYLIFYTFAPSESPHSSQLAVPTHGAKADDSTRGKLSV